MNKTVTAEFDEVLARVTASPPDVRVELARKVLVTVNAGDPANEVAQLSADEVLNTLGTRYS